MRRRAQPWLGTLVEISVEDDAPMVEIDHACDKAFDAVARVHALMSYHAAGSDVSRINRAAVGEAISIHPWTAQVLKTALQFTTDTAGIFDIACAPKLVAWGYLPGSNSDMPAHAAGNAFAFIDTESVQKIRHGWIDLGGIAKGYAVDRAILALQDAGIRSACVNAGGDLRAYGGMRYPVMIRDPSRPTYLRTEVAVENRALATSATYFSRKTVGHLQVSALINGSNGQALTGNHSVSVLAPDCMTADALTKYVAATLDPSSPVLARYQAAAFIMP